MYSELWNNQRRYPVCENKKIEAPYRLCFHPVQISLHFDYSALFSQPASTVKRTRLVVFAQQHLTVSWNWHRLQCYRDNVVPDVQYRRAIHTEQSVERECQPLLCSVCWCQVSIWANFSDSLCWLVCSSSTRLQPDVSQLESYSNLFYFVCLRYCHLKCSHLRPDM